MQQEFTIVLRMLNETDEILTRTQIRQWTKQQFEGCDVGEVKVISVTAKAVGELSDEQLADILSARLKGRNK